MKHSLLLLSVLCISLLSLTSRMSADSIAITQAFISIDLNLGEGNNVSSGMMGPGTQLSGAGGAGCGFCSLGAFLLPGTSVDASVGFIGPLEYLSEVQINGTIYDPNDVSFGGSFITSGTITFPAGNVPMFTVTLPATFGDVHGMIISSGQTVTLNIHPGELVLSFNLIPSSEGVPANYEYAGGEFITTPEPGTLGLMATGLVSLYAVIPRKRLLCHCAER